MLDANPEKINTIIVVKIICIVKIILTSILNWWAMLSATATEIIEAATFAMVFPTRIVISKRLGKAIKLFA